MLVCDGVSKVYGALRAVDELSFSVGRGEVLGIGGPNGAGKTTLFDVISGLSPATSGKVQLDGRDITRSSPERICHLGVARTFQLNAAFDSLTVAENVLVAAYYGRDNRLFPTFHVDRATRARTEEALALVGMADRARERVADLPVLDRKLLMIAGAVVTDPKLLLMDEPVGGLNPSEIAAVAEVVQRLIADRGLTVVLIEHVMRFLIQLSHRVLIMHHGRKLFEGPPDGLARDSQVVEVYLGGGAAERLQRWMGEERADG
jgi:ABC-type branched-subunit amino acid transport system ATPase component